MKRILFLLSIAFTLSAGAQVFNNEWIDYNKTYYKFKVATTGLYRISQSSLLSIGINNVNADQFQLWRNGQQIPLYTSVQGAPLGATDFIEFWGEMNDGKPDNVLFRQADYQISDKWSLQTDSAAFFLTVNPSGTNLRLEPTANNLTGNTLSPEPYFMYKAGQYYKARINPGRSEVVGSSYTYSSSYDAGEGWASGDIGTGVSVTYNITNLRQYSGVGAPDPIFRITATGNAVNARSFRVRLNGDSILGKAMDYFNYAKASKSVAGSLISSGNANFQVTNLCTVSGDRMAIGEIEFTYPRQFDFGGARNFYFELPANTAGNYLEISGFTYTGSSPVLYDLTNGKRYETNNTTASLLKVVLQPSAVDRKLVLVNEAPGNIKAISSFQSRNFINYGLASNQGDYLIISHASLTSASGGSDPVEEYKNYRSSAQGGSYNAKVYLIDQLEDQFGSGIKRHPLSIRNFLRWARVNFPSPLKSVLLIGKGVIYTQFWSGQSNPDMEKLNLVPTFGNPASDILLSAVGSSSFPLTPIGRISVISKDEIYAYLDKVRQYEQVQTLSSPAIADRAWMKNIVHVTGASDDNTSEILLGALNGHKRIIEDTLYAGTVHTFTKNSADAVQQVASTRLSNLFKEGIGILTYFGHSSASTLEFNLDNPQNYDNQGKYPVFIVMGCNAGSFYNFNLARFATKETISERFILAKDRGAIAFFASTHLGIVHYLDIYNSRNYKVISGSKYGATLGEIMNEAIKQVYITTTENDFYARFQCEQFSLHGDPALKYYHFEKPDYVIEEPLVKVSPSFIPVSEKYFRINASFMNIGRAINKSIVVELKRTYPDQSVELIRRDTIVFTKFMDSLSYNIPIVPTRDRGLNKITVTLDAGNQVDELYETNNSVTKDVYIIEDDVRPVYPYNFSIINKQNITLIASTANPFAEMKSYLVEIDTTALFNSPLKLRSTISSGGGPIEYSPAITFTDKTVYYWRVANNVLTGGEPVWNTASFIYMDGPEVGFNQSHLYQHLKSDLNRIKLDSISRLWSFGVNLNNVFARNGVYPTTSDQGGFYTGTINDVEGFIGPGCNYNELIFNVIHPITFVPWKNDYTGPIGLYQSLRATCGPGREYNFQFLLSDISWRTKIVNFLNIIPDGYFVVVRSNTNPNNAGNTYANVWQNDQAILGPGNTLYDKLYNQGFLDVNSYDKPRSFIAMFKKNRQNEFATKSKFSEGIYDAITLDGNAISPDTLGIITSPLMGPAKKWKQLEWEGETLDSVNSDQPLIDVIGVNKQANEITLISGLGINQKNYDISSIDAALFPYLKLKMVNTDTVQFTPYQLKYWRLYYDPVPEGAIAPNIYFTTKDTVNVGETFNFGIGFKNVSNLDFDSVKVKLAITDKDNVENIVPVPRQKALIAGDTIKLNIPVDTKSLSGRNTVFINFNPDDDQPEQYLFNNYAFRNLYVTPDSLNPLMDVTFDGTHILNRDIVSSKPGILVRLSDEMAALALNDTSLLTVNIRYPDGNLRRFNFNSNDTLQFVPAGQGENTASVNFRPYFPDDGEYELIVTGKDRSGNFAGNAQYKITFMVINKPMISNMLNYPNPFTTSTAFVFTVTGSEVPQNIRIQVLTITGKIVREITKDELGPLHIGRNITEFKWDGTDQYGQKLANGIYLYRVITNLNGKTLDKYKAKDDNTDKYFNKGYGKMYLMR